MALIDLAEKHKGDNVKNVESNAVEDKLAEDKVL